jgi:hypothetical protein
MPANRPASHFLEGEEDMRTANGSDDEDGRRPSPGERDDVSVVLVRAAVQLMTDLIIIGAEQDHAALITFIIMRAAITATELALNASRAAKR